jgi:hypothetical protein
MKSLNRYLCLTALLALGLVGAAWAGERGSALKADDIKSEPYRDAQTVGALKAGDAVEILKSQGGWLQVKSVKGNGWVRMLSVRRGAARTGSSDLSGLSGVATGRAGTGQVVATTGIRGLNEEELKAAKFDEAQVKKLESFSVGKAEAKKFAAEGKLAARSLEYLPAPAAGGGR